MFYRWEVLLLLIDLSSHEFLLVTPSSAPSYGAGQKPSFLSALPLVRQWRSDALGTSRRGVTMDTGCVGCISFNDPQLGRGKPSTASSTSHLPASCSLQPRPQSPPRPCASAQRRGELFPKRVFVSPSGSSLFPQSAEFESVPGEQWERQVPRGVAQHTSGSFLPRVPGPPVETARHLCFCYLMTKKKKKKCLNRQVSLLPLRMPQTPRVFRQNPKHGLCLQPPLGVNCSQGSHLPSHYSV